MSRTLSWREWLLQERPNMGPMQVSSFPMAVAFGEINAQIDRSPHLTDHLEQDTAQLVAIN